MGAGRLFHFLVAMPTSEDLFIGAKHLLIYRSMYALADASGATAIDANPPPGWAARKKTPRGQRGRRRQRPRQAF